MAGQSKHASAKGGNFGEFCWKPRQVGEHQNFRLSKKEMEEASKEIVLLCMLHDLHPYNEKGESLADHPQITEMLEGTKDGSNTLEHIEKQYRPYWKELYRFCVKLKDWQSAAIFSDEHRPVNPLPANPWTIELFFLVKIQSTKEAIKHPRTGQICYWPDGDGKTKIIMGTGKWNAESTIKHSHTAIAMCHAPFPKCSGEYHVPCEFCVAANSELLKAPGNLGHNWKMCKHHSSGGALLTCFGNPLTEHHLLKAYMACLKQLKSKHTVQGALQLNAKQLRKIRRALLGNCGNSRAKRFQNFQTWTMMLLGIHLFLRCDELITMDFVQFRTECFEVDREKNRINRIVVWVKGKQDKEPQTLVLYRDDENPEFCPVRHLLIYLATSKIDGGCLFPEWKEYINAKGSNFHGKDHVKYNDFLRTMKVSTTLIWGM